MADRLGEPVSSKPDPHKYKYEVILTNDEDTPGYSSSFILIKSQPMWGFHLIWVDVQGKFRSTTAGFPINSSKIDPREYGVKFLKTFATTSERITKTEHVLGRMDLLENHPEYSVKTMVNVLLMAVYEKMWDLDVNIVKIDEIPKDVLDDFHAFADRTFGESFGD